MTRKGQWLCIQTLCVEVVDEQVPVFTIPEVIHLVVDFHGSLGDLRCALSEVYPLEAKAN